MRTVIVPIVLGALETIPAKLSESLEILEIEDVIALNQLSNLIYSKIEFLQKYTVKNH